MKEQSSTTPEPIWSLGPLSIKRTTDILAFVAFILSTIGLIAQVRDYWRGPEAVLFAPEQVTFGSSKAFKIDFEDEFLIAGVILSYVNHAPAGFNTAVVREHLRFQIGGSKYQYLGHDVVNISSASSNLVVLKKDDAGPFALNAGSALSHEILFLPHPVRCRKHDVECSELLPSIKWSDFKAAVNTNRTIKVTLVADVHGKATLSVQCVVRLDQHDLEGFENKEREWSAPNCYEDAEESFWEKYLISISEVPFPNAY